VRYQIPSIQELRQFAELIAPAADNTSAKARITLAPEEYVKCLDYHGITLLALQTGRLPETVAALLNQRKALMVANDDLKQRALIELFNAFAAAGLRRSVLFKGSALAYSIYPKPWLRPRTDSDVLIDRDDFAEFEDVFYQLGYQKLFAIEGKYISYQSTFSKHLAGQSAINIDCHWRINNRQTLAKSYTVDQLLENGNSLTTLSNNIVIPSNVDSLIIACLHRLGHHLNDERLTWLHDIHLLANELTGEDWQTVIKQCKDKQLSAITLDALQLCKDLFNTPVDQLVIDELSRLSAVREPSQIFLQRDLAEWRYFWHDLKAMDKLADKLRLIIENLIPSPSYVRQQMKTKSAFVAYFMRFTRGLRRII